MLLRLSIIEQLAWRVCMAWNGMLRQRSAGLGAIHGENGNGHGTETQYPGYLLRLKGGNGSDSFP